MRISKEEDQALDEKPGDTLIQRGDFLAGKREENAGEERAL